MTDDNLDEESAFRHISRGASVTLIGRGLSIPLGFLTTILLTRVFGAGVFGGLRYGESILSLALILGTIGLSPGVNRFVATAENKAESLAVFIAGLSMAAVASITFGIIIFFSAESIGELVFGSDDSIIFIQMAGVALPFAALYQLSLAATRGFNYALPTTLYQDILYKLFRFSAMVLVVVWGLGRLGIASAVTLVYLVIGLLAAGTVSWICWRGDQSGTPSLTEDLLSSSLYKRLVVFSVPLLMTKSLWYLMNNIDTLLVGYFLNENAVGIYSVAFSLAVLIKMVQSSMGTLFMTNTANLHESGNIDELRLVYVRTTKWLTILSFPVLIGNFGFPDTLLRVFGEGFDAGMIALVILATGLFSHVIFGMNGTTIQSIDKTKVIFYIQFVTVVPNMILNILLIPIFGLAGAAAATAISYIFNNILLSGYLYKLIGIIPFEPKFMAVSILFLGSAVIGAWVPIVPHDNLILALVYGGIVYLFYIFAIAKMRLINIRFIKQKIESIAPW